MFAIVCKRPAPDTRGRAAMVGGMTTHKIVAFNGKFTNLKAFLHHIAEDEDAIAFVGCVLRKDGNFVPVQFEITRQQMSFAAAMWMQLCMEGSDPEEDKGAA